MNTLRIKYKILFAVLEIVYFMTNSELSAQMEVDVMSNDIAYLASGGNMGYYSLNSTGTGFRATNTAQSGFISSESGGTGFSSFGSSSRGFFAAAPVSHGFHSLTAGTYGFFADNSIQAGFLCDNSNGDSFRSMDCDGHGFISLDAGQNGFRAERPNSKGFAVLDAGSAGFSTSGSASYGYFNSGSDIDGYYSINAGGSGFRSAYAQGSGFSSSGSAFHGLDIINSTFDGINIQASGANGISILNSDNDGIQSTGAKGRAGFCINDESSINPALYVGHGDNTKYDLQLSRTGRIAAELSMVLYLGINGDGGQLIVRNDDDENVATISQNGNADFTGIVTKGGGTFKIDHPLEPTEKYLYHSFVESPDMMNIYNGNVVTDQHGMAAVQLPDYFEALNMDFRYQLTVIGTFAQAIIKEEIRNNAFIIQTSQPNVKVSWQVTGVRQDPYANMNRVEPVVEKESEEKGSYLHPEAWAKSLNKVDLIQENEKIDN